MSSYLPAMVKLPSANYRYIGTPLNQYKDFLMKRAYSSTNIASVKYVGPSSTEREMI